MSEQIMKSVFEIFAQTQQTYAEAQKKRESEQTVKKIERFRTAEDGEYKVRVLPLAPVLDEDGKMQEMDRKGYEYPVQQQFITIKVPAKGKKKASKINIPVVRTTQKGVDLPVDIIDTYVTIAKEYDDEAVTKKVSENGYSGGLKWNYQHAIYVLDCNKNRKGPLLYTCSGAQYHQIEDEKFNIWDQLRENRPERPDECPLSSFTNAYVLTIKRTNNNNKTEYKFSINALGKEDALSESELNALLAASRIPDEIYRYTRYQFEATLVFLQQYDEMLQLDVCEQEDFKAAVEKLRAALPKEDTSHFSLDSADNKAGEGKAKNVEETLDTLWDENDYIEDQGLGRNSNEYMELREKISQYVQDHELDMRISHSKTNAQILSDIEELENNNAQKVSKSADDENASGDAPKNDDPKDEEIPTRRKRASYQKDEEGDENGQQQEEAHAENNEQPDSEHEEEPARRTRKRPADDEEEPSNNGDSNENQQEEEAPVRRRRRR